MSSRAAVLSRAQLRLAELLDRTRGAGVVAAWDVTLSVAGVGLAGNDAGATSRGMASGSSEASRSSS